MAKRQKINVNVSAHHTNGISTPDETFADVQSVTVSAVESDWLNKIHVEFNKDGSVTVSVRYDHPRDEETWASADLTVRGDGTITLNH